MHNLSAAKSTGLCLSAFIDQRCFEGMLELHRDGMIERKIILKLRSRTPSLLQDCASLPVLLGLSGIRVYLKSRKETINPKSHLAEKPRLRDDPTLRGSMDSTISVRKENG